ncbi:MAG: alpha/beta fold hydrolase [Chthoniobacterales bacterium]
MPLIDLPLADLHRYLGRNPRPVDFDEFWDNGLSELDALDGEVELERAEFEAPVADCFHLTFTGVGGSRIHAKYLRPKMAAASCPHPALLRFHGYAGSSGDWFGHLPYVGLGMSVAALDCRGQGGASEDRGGIHGTTCRGQVTRGIDDSPENMLFRQIFMDTAQLARIVSGFDEVDPTRLAAQGGSQGGALTLACAALHPPLARAAAAFPFLCDYRRIWEMDLAKGAYEDLRDYFRRFDPRHEREEEIFTRLGYIDVQHLAPRIKAQTLFATGLMDSTCPPSTQFAAYNKITAKKDLIVYPDYGHEELPGCNDAFYQFLSGV